MIVDQVDNFVLTNEQTNQYFNELHSLAYLSEGLNFLYGQIRKIEDDVVARLDPHKLVSIFGNAPQLQGVPQGLVACAFHWYAVSVCNYVRLTGWLTHGNDPDRATEYVNQVIPAVHLWRNKVAAHFSITDPRSNDTPADLAKSVVFPISFDDDAFFAGSLTLSMSRAGRASKSRQDMRWSLTHCHNDLCARYGMLRNA